MLPVLTKLGVSAFALALSASALANSFASIAYSTVSGRYGYAYGHFDRWSARQSALANCGDWTCREVVWVANGCAALAVNPYDARVFGYGYQTGLSIYAANVAASRALSFCQGHGWGACQVLTYTCSG